MAKIHINKDKCKGCYLCVVNCPNNLIKISDKLNAKGIKPVKVSEGKCLGCALCALICPECIIEVYK